MRPLFACDLDRTLIYTVRSAALGSDRDEAETDGLRCVERVHGEPYSYVAEEVPDLLRRLRELCEFVPVTTRSRGQYRRVELFRGRHQPEWAVCANGGHLLYRGRPDGDWHRTMIDRVSATGVDHGEVARRLARLGGWVTSARVADSVFAYALVDVGAADEGAIADLAAWLDEQGWVLSRQGRKLYAAPAGLDKGTAVEEVRRRIGATRVGAAGDSILDQLMLDRADFSVRPPHGELALIAHPADVIVAVPGIAAGAEVLRAAIAWAEVSRREVEVR